MYFVLKYKFYKRLEVHFFGPYDCTINPTFPYVVITTPENHLGRRVYACLPVCNVFLYNMDLALF